MSQPMILPGQPQDDKDRPMTYQELVAECTSLKEELSYANEDVDYLKKVVAQEQAYSASGKSVNTSRERFANRILDQVVPEGEKPVSKELYITRTKLFELLALIPSLARRDARRFIRDWEDIETLAQGDGNQQIVRSRQERLLFELQIARSIGDAPITGMTTFQGLITDRTESDTKINMPPQRKPQGWFDGLTGNGGNL